MKNDTFKKWTEFLLGLISVISGLFSIIQFVNENYLLGVILLLAALFLVFIFITTRRFFTDNEFQYNLSKAIKHPVCGCQYGYNILELSKTYRVIDREHFEHFVSHHIKSKMKDIRFFSDKFRWSRHLSSDFVKNNLVALEEDQHINSIERKDGFFQYCVEFPPLDKGGRTQISVEIKNLLDQNHESEPFLSSGIICKTSKLVLTVLIPESLCRKACYLIYKNYHDSAPIIKREISYMKNIGGFQITEDDPLVGYRYVIDWKYSTSGIIR